MPRGEFRVSINGFRVNAETWDDASQSDGKRDEVSCRTGITVASPTSGSYFTQRVSPVLGDTNQHNGRIRAGSASNKGGLRTGDTFPTSTPWARSALNGLDYPPCSVWQGSLTRGEDVVLVTPTIWEWDPGTHFLQGWARWGADTVAKMKNRLPDLLAPGKPVIDALSLGLDMVVTVFDPGGPMGQAQSRPIGMVPDPGNAKNSIFNPYVLVLNYDNADRIAREEPSGLGRGVLSVQYEDSPDRRGDYALYVQVDRLDAGSATIRLRSMNFPSRFVRHRNWLAELTEVGSAADRADAEFRAVPGLYLPALTSFESVNAPGHFLRHQGFRLKLQRRTDEPLFALDSTFREQPGLADPAGSSYESVNFPGHFLRHRNFEMHLDPFREEALYRQDATFHKAP